MKPDNLKPLVKEFELSLKLLNRRKKTVKELVRKINKFTDFLHLTDINQVDNITKDIVKIYQTELYHQINYKGQPNTSAYQNRMLGSVKQFLSFLHEEGYILSNPSKNIPYAKESKRLPQSILTRSEVRKILKMPDTANLIGYRDKTILEIFYSSGIRKTELRDLKLNDVDYHDGVMRVMGKGRKERFVPIGRIACKYLENYIKSIRLELLKDPLNPYVFLSSRGNRLNHNAVWKMVKKYAVKAKIKKNIHCHTFRHTCATTMLKNKADIRIIQELLGHSSLSSTQVYTRINITDLKAIHKKCHPREQDAL